MSIDRMMRGHLLQSLQHYRVCWPDICSFVKKSTITILLFCDFSGHFPFLSFLLKLFKSYLYGICHFVKYIIDIQNVQKKIPLWGAQQISALQVCLLQFAWRYQRGIYIYNFNWTFISLVKMNRVAELKGSVTTVRYHNCKVLQWWNI